MSAVGPVGGGEPYTVDRGSIIAVTKVWFESAQRRVVSQGTQFMTTRSLTLTATILTGLMLAAAAMPALAAGAPLVHWTKLVDPAGRTGASLGYAVALDGGVLVIGQEDRNHNDPVPGGTVLVHRAAGQTWPREAALRPADPKRGSDFGEAVAIDGETIVVGAPALSVVYVFERAGGVWTQTARLTASDTTDYDRFGAAVALHGDTLVVGAPFDDDAGPESGGAYVFVRTASGWSQEAKLVAHDAATRAYFGHAVDIDGGIVVVGAPKASDGVGRAYVFARAGAVWSQEAVLAAADGRVGDEFGTSVALAGETVAVGAPYHDDIRFNAGAVFLFEREDGGWAQEAELVPSGVAASAWTGVSVALDGDTLLVGARGDAGIAANTGAAYLYERAASAWGSPRKLVVSDGASLDGFGFAVALSRATFVVAAPSDDDVGANSGSVHIFGLDTDTDGRPDDVDNCPSLSNANQADLDQDGMGDVCDDDIDGDGLANADEPRYGTHVYRADTDFDGLLDGAEVQRGTDPLDPDTDGDGYADGTEVDHGADPLDPTSIPLSPDARPTLPTTAFEAQRRLAKVSAFLMGKLP